MNDEPSRLQLLHFARRVVVQQATAALAQIDADSVHRGDCWAAAKSGRCRPVSRDQAVQALRHQVPACIHCRPDTALGILD